MKHILSILLFCVGLTINAQNISVSDFKLDEMDLTANQQGTIVLDQNGEKCALIKVITTQTGFTFDVGSLGVQKTLQKAGEIWVYVPAGVRKISISHPQIGQLRDYQLPVTTQRAKTYVMQLVAGNVKTIIETDDGKTYFSLTVTPKNAMVTIDGNLENLDADGSLIKRMSRGQHTYTIQASGYATKTVPFTLGATKLSKSETLESVMANVNITCGTTGADIYVNDVKKGTDRWNGQLSAGDYLIEARKTGYYPQKQGVTLGQKENKTIALPSLTARTGKLDVSFKPVDCEVYIDGKKVGTSPDLFSGVLIGSHKVEIKKAGYVTEIKTITIAEGETMSLNGVLKASTASNSGSASASGNTLKFTVNGVTFEMVKVRGGTFTMGGTAEQGSDAESAEKPTHQVAVSNYFIGKHEVTQELWQVIMGGNPSKFKGDNLPVENISWYDYQIFIKKLNQQTDKNFRLPTEAEWEYACRGGNKSKSYKYSGSNNLDDVGWYTGNSGRKTHEVGTKQPNELGIYDMSGNVCEWCSDWYYSYNSSAQTNPTGASSGLYRLCRGGGWGYDAKGCRSSFRLGNTPNSRDYGLGFRLALSENEENRASNTSTISNEKVYDNAEQMPFYPGGTGALMKYLSSNVKYPVKCKESGIQGRVIVTFIVEKDGSITGVKVTHGIDPDLDQEAVRVVSSMPKWYPGKQNGETVRVKYALPVTFRL